MKNLGILLFITGTIWALISFDMDTTVSTGSTWIGNQYIPSQLVHNFGKADQKRNHLIFSGLITIVGILLFAVEKMKAPKKQPTASNLRKCPFCAEEIKREAVICRFCQKEVPPPEPDPNLCPVCQAGEPYIDVYNKWYCPVCEKYIDRTK